MADRDKSEPDDSAEGTTGSPGAGSSEGGESVDISETTAPSIGPNTVIEKDTAEERLARHEQSDKDAMGLEKRREVVGGSYGASRSRQLVVYAAAIAVAIGGGFGLKQLAAELDKPDAKVADQAPWTGTHKAPKPIQ